MNKIMDDDYFLLSLLSVPGIGSKRIRTLVAHFGSTQAAVQADQNQLICVEGFDKKTAVMIKQQVNSQFVDHQLAEIRKYDVKLVSYWHPDYPQMLKKIHDPPVLLYVKGNLIEEDVNSIAIVGMRAASQYGRSMAERFGFELAQRGITVVSGLARGVDTQSHRGALKANGRTIAVLGCGLDICYPPENKKLFKQITENGAIVSEFPMNTEPSGGHFPRRNRIISGLSLGTLVAEAGEKSGALITAYIALEQDREVFAIPGNIQSMKSKGVNKLIKEGAKLVDHIDDIISEIPQLESMKKPTGVQNTPVHLTDSEKIIWEYLSDKPIHIDEITAKTSMGTSEALALLLSLELKDRVKQLSGMNFVRR